MDNMENAIIRVNTDTQQGSAIDLVRMVLQCNSSDANTALRRLKEDFPELGNQLTMIRINSKGRLSPVADAKTLIEIAMLLPGKASTRFRWESAGTVCRVMGGDLKLLEEMKQNDQKWSRSPSRTTWTKSIGIMDNVDNANIRVHTGTQQGSAIDLVRMVLGCDASSANTALRRLKEDYPELGTQLTWLRINGKGQLTPVTDAKTLIQMVMLLPGKVSSRFRWDSAGTVCRVMGGDKRLLEEIQRNDQKWKLIEGGPVIQQALLKKTEYRDVEQEKSPRVSESLVRNDLAVVVGGEIEVETPAGFIDVLSDIEVIEVKYYKKWKHGLGQVLAYQSFLPHLAKRLHLFAHIGDVDTLKVLALAKSVCGVHTVEVTFGMVPETCTVSGDQRTLVKRKRV